MTASTLRVGAVVSLTGRFARFGTQAARGLRAWSQAAGAPGVEIVDDGGEAAAVPSALRDLAGRCDLLLGPYSTVLVRAAAAWAREHGALVWNHGGSGDDVQGSAPGRLVSVLAPTSRYADRFVDHLAAAHPGLGLRLVAGRGSFGRQVVEGARRSAERRSVSLVEHDEGAVFLAGSFEEDTALVNELIGKRPPPVVLGTVAAGVADFADAVPRTDGILGVAQWVPGAAPPVEVGPTESALLSAYGNTPDYPAVQAAAAAAVAVHCADAAGSTAPDDLWAAATSLRTRTVLGEFAVDPSTGSQTAHTLPLVRWSQRRMERGPADHPATGRTTGATAR